jgi:AcrR family transcriptional regulator
MNNASVSVRKPGRPADPTLADRRREEILDAAVKLFARHGFTETDTQVLANKLQVGKGTIYRYFCSKEELFLAAVDRVMRQLRQKVDAVIAEVEDPLQAIALAIRTFLTFVAQNPDLVELLIQERAQFKDRKKPTYFEYREASLERWKAVYRDLIARGRVRDIPVERMTDVIGDLVYGTMFTNYFNGPRKPPAEQAQDILDIVFQGILTEPGRKQWTGPIAKQEK